MKIFDCLANFKKKGEIMKVLNYSLIFIGIVLMTLCFFIFKDIHKIYAKQQSSYLISMPQNFPCKNSHKMKIELFCEGCGKKETFEMPITSYHFCSNKCLAKFTKENLLKYSQKQQEKTK